MQPNVDALLWALVLPLFLAALWLSRPRPRDWDARAMFEVARAVLGGATVAVEQAALAPRARVGVACEEAAVRRWAQGRAPAGSPVDAADGVAVALARRAATVLWWGPRTLDLATPGWDLVDLGDAPTPEMEATLEGLLALPARRFVVVVSAGAAAFLPFFADVPGLRDRTRAVVLADADLGACTDWLAERFNHTALDLEVDRALPWIALGPRASGRLPSPPADPTGRVSIEVVDLGPVDPADPTVGPALLLLLAALA